MAVFHRRHFLRQQDGAVSVVAALSIFMLLAIAAVVIDTGSLYFARRSLQATSDAAALAAVQDPADAAAVAASVFARNGYDASGLTVTTGAYTADESLSANARFVAAGSGINAVRVRATVQQPTFFGPLFGLATHSALTTQATAARIPTVSFGAGSRLAELDSGILNNLLGQLWGSSLSLSLVDYQALLTTNIDALTFLNQLATDINVTGSYQQLASASVTTGQIISALIEAGDVSGATSGDSAAALLALQGLQSQISSSTLLKLSDVIDMSSLNGRSIGGIASAGDQGLQLNMMSLLSASARTAASGQLNNIGTSLSIPVTGSSVSAQLAVGSPMTQVAAAQVGTTIHTAQIRIALTVTLASINLGVAATTVQVPIYLEAAAGQAKLTAMPCTAGGTLAEIDASSGATTLQFGSVNGATLADFSAAVTPVPAPVASLSLLGIPVQVNIAGTSSVAGSGPQTLTFTQADIDAGTVKSVPGAGQTPFAALGTGMTFSASALSDPGLLGSLLNSQLSSLTTALNPVVANILNQLDSPVNSVMTALGLQLGITDVRVFDAKCRTPTLVG